MEGVARRILVTGTSGVLGDAAARALEESGHAVIRHRGREDGDLAHPAEARSWVVRANPDAIINTAGLTYGSAEELWAANAVIPLRIADAIRALQPGVRLVLVSSAAVYGLPPAGASIAESHPLAPNSDYGFSKLAAERLSRALSTRVHAARVFNILTDTADPRSLLARVRAAYQAGDDAPRGCRAVRDWVTPEFVAAALARIATAPRPPDVTNVCSGHGRTCAEVLGRQAEPDLADWSVGDPTLLGEALGLYAEPSTAR